jgi:hypothetical protein
VAGLHDEQLEVRAAGRKNGDIPGSIKWMRPSIPTSHLFLDLVRLFIFVYWKGNKRVSRIILIRIWSFRSVLRVFPMRTHCFALALALAVASLSALPAFSQIDFTYQQYPSPTTSAASVVAPNAHSADFNEDGLADVLAVTSDPAGLYLYLNNGSGGLSAPKQVPVTFGASSFATSDSEVVISNFNGDGHLDIAVLSPTGTVSLLYGHGDGTFAAPVTIQLPAAGSHNSYIALVEADFDVNNTQDLAALDSSGNLTLLFNNGKGGFTQQQVKLDTPPSGFTDADLVVGDFNGDGRPDLAWVEDGDIGTQGSTVWSALNTTKGVFSPKNQVGKLPVGAGNVLSADLDLDGKSDLITWATQLTENCCSEYPISLYYSLGNGTFAGSILASTVSTDIGVTDINGDGIPDVVIAGNLGISVYLGNGNRAFTGQGDYSLPGGAFPIGLGFYQDTNRMGLTSTNAYAMNEADSTFLYEIVNNNAQGNCAYPSSPGISFCSSVQEGSQVRVRGTARALAQPVRHIEIWANGKKLYQVFSDEFDATLNLPTGTKITAVEVEANGATRSATTVQPSGACAAPSSPGVKVCSPSAGQSVSPPVYVIASGTGASGSVNHLELWVDGNKIGNYTGSMMNASVSLPSGSHTATVIEVDSKGAYVKSTPVTFAVK